MENYCKVTTINYALKNGTKTSYIETDRKESIFNELQYRNCVEASPFFRRLGGSETQQRTHTSKGYNVFRIISKSPDRTMKTVREFNFDI